MCTQYHGYKSISIATLHRSPSIASFSTVFVIHMVGAQHTMLVGSAAAFLFSKAWRAYVVSHAVQAARQRAQSGRTVGKAEKPRANVSLDQLYGMAKQYSPKPNADVSAKPVVSAAKES